MKKNQLKENMREYESLRNEIISMQEMQRNVWIYMYVLFCSLFVLGLQWSYYLFLVTYIILIPFQCVINDFLWSVAKMSTYIRVFYEESKKDMNWESLHIYDLYRNYYVRKSSSLSGIIRVSGSIHLGIIATVFFCWSILTENYKNGHFILSGLDIFLIICSLLLLFTIIKINNDYKKSYNLELEEIMRKYKKDIMGN